jgi:endonuclease YncB( thermonuclease family)
MNMSGVRIATSIPTLALLAALATGQAPTIPTKDFAGQEPEKVEFIVDGDTLFVSGDWGPYRVRLLGLDTPESGSPLGDEATRFLEHLLLGEHVYVETDRKNETGASGGGWAYLYRAPDGLFVNLEIVRQGYGKVYRKAPFEHRALFDHFESAARDAEKGVWSAVGPSPRAKPAPKVQPKAKRAAQEGVTVYVTRTGAKYHRGTCSYLRKSRIAMKLDEAKRRYSPCSRCRPPP